MFFMLVGACLLQSTIDYKMFTVSRKKSLFILPADHKTIFFQNTPSSQSQFARWWRSNWPSTGGLVSVSLRKL